MKIWLAGSAEPRDYDPRQTVELITSNSLLKDTPIYDESCQKWVSAGVHPATSAFFVGPAIQASSDEPALPLAPARHIGFACTAWGGLAVAAGGGIVLHSLLSASISRLFGFLAIGVFLWALVWIGTRMAIPGWPSRDRAFRWAVVAAITATLWIVALAVELPSLREQSSKRACELAWTSLCRGVNLGLVPRKTYGRFVYGRYAPYLNLIHTMAFDYEKEIADYHAERSALVNENAGLAGFLDDRNKLVEFRLALDKFGTATAAHREDILAKLDTYRLRFENLPYPPEVRTKLLAKYTELEGDVERMVGTYFDHMDAERTALDQWAAFFLNNPQAYTRASMGFSANYQGGGSGVQRFRNLPSVNIEFTDPIYANEARAYTAKIVLSLDKEIAIQRDINDYYSGKGGEIISDMEHLIENEL